MCSVLTGQLGLWEEGGGACMQGAHHLQAMAGAEPLLRILVSAWCNSVC